MRRQTQSPGGFRTMSPAATGASTADVSTRSSPVSRSGAPASSQHVGEGGGGGTRIDGDGCNGAAPSTQQKIVGQKSATTAVAPAVPATTVSEVSEADVFEDVVDLSQSPEKKHHPRSPQQHRVLQPSMGSSVSTPPPRQLHMQQNENDVATAVGGGGEAGVREVRARPATTLAATTAVATTAAGAKPAGGALSAEVKVCVACFCSLE